MKKLIGIAIVLSLSLFSCTTEVEKECSRCYGAGKIEVKEDCTSCKGKGRVFCTTEHTFHYTWFAGGGTETVTCDGGTFYCPRGVGTKTCWACNGSSYHDCYTCNGYGYKKKNKSCSSCGGDGKVWQEVKVWETW